MASSFLNVGDAFLLLDTPPDGKHLYVVIAPISQETFLFVNLTTRRDNSDSSCIILPHSGVPNFIKHESVIAYKYAREIKEIVIISLIEKGNCIKQGRFSPNIIYKIQRGGLDSRQLKNKYKEILRNLLEL